MGKWTAGRWNLPSQRINFTKRTLADGSFDINLLFAPRPGANLIQAKATNPATGETCMASAAL